MGEYLSPGVYVEEMAGPRPIEGASTSTAAFVGYTAKGEPGKPKFVTSFGDYERHFGGFRKEVDSFTPFAVKNFFDEGGSKAYVVRHAEKDASGEYKGSAAGCEISVGFKVSVTDPVTGVFEDNTSGPNEYDCTGTNGDKISFTVKESTGTTVEYDKMFSIDFFYTHPTSSIGKKKFGTIENVTMENLVDKLSEAKSTLFYDGANLIDLSDVITISNVSNSLSTPPFGDFTLANGVTQVGPTVATHTLNDLTITTVGTGISCDIKVIAGANTTTDRTLEIYNRDTTQLVAKVENINLGTNKTPATTGILKFTGALTALPAVMAPNDPLIEMAGGAAIPAVASAQSTGSDVIFDVSASSKGSWGDDVTVTISSLSFLKDLDTGGNQNTEAGIEVNEKFTLSVYYKNTEVETFEDLTINKPLAASYVATVVNGASNYITIDEDSVVNDKKIPIGAFSLAGGLDDAIPSSRKISQSTLKEYLGDTDGISMLITPDVLDMADQKEGASYCDNRGDCFYIASSNKTLNGGLAEDKTAIGGMSRCALYAPYIIQTHPESAKAIEVPPAGAIAGIYARTDKNRGVFKAPAGTADGQVRTALGLTHLFTKAEQSMLNPIGINLIRNISGVGNVIWGARTTAADAQWRYVPVRRLVTYIEKSIENSIQWAVFEPNSHELWSQLKREISGFLRGIWSVGGLFGKTEDEAFFVKVDEENNPQSSRDAGKLIVNIGVATVKPAEFVIIRIEQTQSDS